MQGKSKILGLVFALFVIIIAVLYMAGSFTQKQTAGLKNIEAQSYSGKQITVALEPIQLVERVPGSVIAKQNTQISSRVMAQIEKFNVRAGNRVSKGDVLITLQQDDFKAKVTQSKAQISAIQASLTQAKNQLARVKELSDKKLVSVSELDDAQAKFDTLTANLAVAKQQQEQAKISLNFTSITAPIAGVVVERLAEPGDTVTPGTALMALYNPLQLQVEFNIRERQAVKLKTGDELSVIFPSLNIQSQAIVSEIIPVADKAARSLLVRLDFDSQLGLIPGLYAQLVLLLNKHQGILVPEEAVHNFGELNMVYVIENQNIQRRFIRLGDIIDGRQHIIAGLNSGDKLAIEYDPK
ncbi:efflux RND transporter periplasmic adaptor subunit [Pseudoalteromonas carrageenovora]|uniref:efflux RND transporter periplasmic adaptor subunit n=1 Tax=Pseudoalteromonas carrageenovora TaxID=227 RepID=UPI0026E26EED|nr:efflux RND transporter periplasmic adaptor subunit [Pseudoalteromonas carrageenovora]MDO6836893.1 efflux RND transporter periplasmic adaptor subunit [Pseudoalteromonas carrageenovora]